MLEIIPSAPTTSLSDLEAPAARRTRGPLALALSLLALPSCSKFVSPDPDEITAAIDRKFERKDAELHLKLLRERQLMVNEIESALQRIFPKLLAEVEARSGTIIDRSVARAYNQIVPEAIDQVTRALKVASVEDQPIPSIPVTDHLLEALKIRQMERATVKLSGGNTVGSGVVIFSGQFKEDPSATIILTAYHVVRDILETERRADPIKAHFYLTPTGDTTSAALIATDTENDLALLLVKDHYHPEQARLLPESTSSQIVKPGLPITAYGCPVGIDPIPTEGRVGRTNEIINDIPHHFITAAGYFGSSGGGVWHFVKQADSPLPQAYLLGLYSKVYTVGNSYPTVIPHLGLMGDPKAMIKFLEQSGFSINELTGKVTFANPDGDTKEAPLAAPSGYAPQTLGK